VKLASRGQFGGDDLPPLMIRVEFCEVLTMRNLLLVSAAALALASVPARADVVFLQSILGTTGEGFGDDHRLLDLHQESGNETGAMIPLNTCTGQAVCTGSGDKASTPTAAAMGWVTGANVGLGFDVSQTGGTGLTLNHLGFTLYTTTDGGLTYHAISGAGITPTFDLGSIFQITPGMNDTIGNGKGTNNFVLTALEQTEFNADLAAFGVGNLIVGGFGDWGCPGAQTPACMQANDGQDSLFGFNQASVSVPGPVVGAGVPGAAFAALGLLWLGRGRRRI